MTYFFLSLFSRTYSIGPLANLFCVILDTREQSLKQQSTTQILYVCHNPVTKAKQIPALISLKFLICLII